jgi:hypothetical protein
LRTALFWAVTRHLVAIPYRGFDSLSVQFSKVKKSNKDSAWNDLYTLCDVTEYSSSHILRGGLMKSRTALFPLSRDRMKAGSYSIHSIGRFKLIPLSVLLLGPAKQNSSLQALSCRWFIRRTASLLFGANIYTECPGRNVKNFGRVFLMLKYTDITQNTYISKVERLRR